LPDQTLAGPPALGPQPGLCCLIRPSLDHLRLPADAEGRARLRGYAAQFSRAVSDLLRRIPRPLLLLLKTNDCLRTIDAALGQVGGAPNLARRTYFGSPCT
jgi:hypothetical protein